MNPEAPMRSLAPRVIRRVLRIDGLSEASSVVAVRWGLGLACLAVGLRLFFWAYTGRLWEDALITVLHAENFVRGLGLTHYSVGEPPVHGFTSPISVLVPLVGEVLHPGFGLSFIKIVGALCGGVAVLYALGLSIHPKTRLPVPMAVLFMGYLACEHHQILWGMSGMETQIVTAILLGSIYYLVAWKPAALGVSLGLCMLARPDFAFWTVLVGGYVLLRDRRQFLKVVVLALALYLPWIVFTTLYYGSPIPNTILAKGMGYRPWWDAAGLTLGDVKRVVWDRISGSYLPNTIFQPLGPSFAGHGTGFRCVIADHGLIADAMVAFALLGTLGALVRRRWALFTAALFVFVYSLYYVFLVPYVFGWYVVPFVAVTIFLSVHGMAWVSGVITRPRVRTGLLCAMTVGYLGWVVGLLPLTFRTEKQIQERVENRIRKEMGLYLGRVMGPDETVGCEPLGYIGYYSHRTVYDWPGLASRKVVEYSRTHPEGRHMFDMIEALRPDYLALRVHEYNALAGYHGGWVDRDYRLVKGFSAFPDDLNDIFLINCNQDRFFMVFEKRHKAADVKAPAGQQP